MNKFEFMTSDRIIFERNGITSIGRLAKPFGEKALIVTGSRSENAEVIKELLNTEGIASVLFQVTEEPGLQTTKLGLDLAREEKFDLVIACGGGSAIDSGKIIAAMMKNDGDILSYLEVIGEGKSLTNPSAPCIAIPTTAGTGAEVTKNAVISSDEHKVKVSLRSPYMYPDLVLLDPTLTVSMPKGVTASTGLDALTQVIEPFVSHLANPITDAFCREGMKLASTSLRKAFDSGEDLEARENMLLASLFGGIALANAKLGVVHGFAGVIGGMYGIPHGIVCAGLLPYSIETNVKALKEREQENKALVRYKEVAEILTGDKNATIEDGMKWISDLCMHLSIPKFETFGMKKEDFPEIIEKSMGASSMKGNPITLTEEELEEMLNKAFH
ncbi:MAG TPA: iron-containing alcohol dehydrogenase [Bacteroidales bacterium]|nr:iron-containing alcohol dehydrogenase [Bacteroidales bacterium]